MSKHQIAEHCRRCKEATHKIAMRDDERLKRTHLLYCHIAESPELRGNNHRLPRQHWALVDGGLASHLDVIMGTQDRHRDKAREEERVGVEVEGVRMRVCCTSLPPRARLATGIFSSRRNAILGLKRLSISPSFAVCQPISISSSCP